MPRITRKICRELAYFTNSFHSKVDFVSLLVSFDCNFKCRACSIWQKEKSKVLAAEDWLKIAKKIRKVARQEALVEINGGEPLLHQPLVLAIIRELKKYFKQVALNTNGSLIDSKIIAELKAAGLDILKISLYSNQPSTHDFLRGFSGSFEKARNALQIIAVSGIKLEVGVLITEKNIEDLPKLIRRLAETENISIILQPLDEIIESADSKNRNKNYLPKALWPAPDKVKKFFQWLKQNRRIIKNSSAAIRAMENYYLSSEKVLRYRCFAGQRSLVIYPDGQISFCFKGKKIGNILQNKILKVMQSEAASRERKAIKKCRKYCRIIGCNFSRGIQEFMADKMY